MKHSDLESLIKCAIKHTQRMESIEFDLGDVLDFFFI